MALLTWREATRTYELVVPHQTVGGGHCDYEVREFPAGLMRLGTIHSHAGIDAFHSWRDSEDERFEDGFHLTIGNLDTDLTLSCSVVVQGARGPIPPERLFSPSPSPGSRRRRSRNGPKKWTGKSLPCPLPSSSGRDESCQLSAVSYQHSSRDLSYYEEMRGLSMEVAEAKRRLADFINKLNADR